MMMMIYDIFSFNAGESWNLVAVVSLSRGSTSSRIPSRSAMRKEIRPEGKEMDIVGTNGARRDRNRRAMIRSKC